MVIGTAPTRNRMTTRHTMSCRLNQTRALLPTSMQMVRTGTVALTPTLHAMAGTMLLLLRVLQGMSGGLIYGAAPALVTLSLPASRHGWGLGWASTGLGLGLGVSPLIGGVLVGAFGWRGVFLYRVPIAAAMIVLAA